MSTLEVIKFRDILRVASVSLVPGLPMPTVELKGDDFRSVETVSINDSSVPEFILIDKNTIYVAEAVKKNKVIFQIGTKSKKISGLLKLVQLYTKILLQSPGSDIFDPDMGGGLQDMVGRLTSTRRNDRMLAAISQSISQAEAQVRRAQLDAAEIPLEERLLSATLLDIRMFQATDEARARILITNVAGQRGEAAIEL